jgi:hypothetical protein
LSGLFDARHESAFKLKMKTINGIASFR